MNLKARFSVIIEGKDAFEERFAGKMETDDAGKTDALMGGMFTCFDGF
ncbi:MAG TPA: hypothetical protein VIH61_02145 [Waddliaceae bacterium]